MFKFCVMSLVVGVCFFVAATAGYFSQPITGALVLLGTVYLLAVFNVCSAAGYSYDGHASVLPMLWVRAVIEMGVGYFGFYFQRLLAEFLCIYGFLIFFTTLVSSIVTYGDMRLFGYPLLDFELYVGVTFFIVGGMMIVNKERVIDRVSRRLADDSRLYLQAWEEMLRDKAEVKTLQDITELCRIIKASTGNSEIIHQVRGRPFCRA